MRMNMAELGNEGSGEVNDHQPVRSCNLCRQRGLQEVFITW